MSAVVIFGIPNCDTVKKARDWLDKRNIDYQFHDFRRDGLTNKQIKSWLTQVDVEILLNKRSRSWRNLSETDKSHLTENKAIKLMLNQPSLIKRPVLVKGKKINIGFDPKDYQSLFNNE
ncbi:MAG: ArsC family reductase [Thioalkalispiraceae bacterium]|jgi:arsenate reductase